MAATTGSQSPDSYIITADSEDDCELELTHRRTGETYAVVDYADSLLAEKLSAYGTGSAVRVELAPVGEAGYKLTRFVPGAAPRTGLAR